MTENENQEFDKEKLYPPEIQDAYDTGRKNLRHKQKERMIRKKRKEKKKLKSLFRFLLLVFLVYSCYKFFHLRGWYLPSDVFSNKDKNRIEIINNKIVPTEMLYDSIKNINVLHMPIFMFRVQPIKKELFKIPVIDRIYVRRYGFPARIKIIVRERTPLAIVKKDINSKPFAFYTTDGVLVTNGNYMNNVPTDNTIKILGSDFSPNNPNWDMDKILELKKIIEDVETYSNEKVEYIDVRNQNDVYVKIESTSIRLGLLDSTVFERIKRIYTILPQINEYNNQIRYIDLSWDKVNYLKLQQDKKQKNDEKPSDKE